MVSPITIQAASGFLSPLQNTLYKYIHIGDSITQGSSDMQSYVWGSTDLVWQTALRSNSMLLPLRNAGIGGQTSPMIASRVTRDVLKYRPDVVGATMGTNDVIILNSSSYISASIHAFHTAAQNAGLFHFLTTIPPYSSRASVVDEINEIIRMFCSENGVPLVDLYALANDPSNPGNWRPNWSADGTHQTTLTGDRFGSEICRVILPYLTSTRHQWRPLVQDVGSLLFPTSGVTNTGSPASSTVRDGLFSNYRTLTMNGYSLIVPRLWDAVSTTTGLGLTATGSIETIAGVPGNVWKVTASANAGGAGSMLWSMVHSAPSPIIDLRQYQGRRIKFTFWFGTEGFSAINTDAYVAGNSGALLASCYIDVGIRNASGSSIGGTYIQDPVDPSQTLGTSDNIAMQWGTTLWYQSSGYRMGYDIPITPVSVEFNVPPGAHSLNIQGGPRFFAGGLGPVEMRLGGFGLADIGPATYPAIVVNNDPVRFLKISATTTLTRADLLAYDVYLVDATSGPVTINLPSAVVLYGMRSTFKKTDSSANAVTIDPNGSETIDGATTYSLSSQYDFVSAFVENGNWQIISKGI